MKIPGFPTQQHLRAFMLYERFEDISCANYVFDITYDNLLFISLEHSNLEVMWKINTLMLLILIVNQLYIR